MTETSQQTRRHFWILPIAIAVMLNVIAILSGVGIHGPTIFVGGVIGIHFAEVVFVAVCTAMLPWNFVTRSVAGVAAIGLIAFSLAISMRFARNPLPYILAAVAFCQWLIYLMPLSWLRINKWRLGVPSESLAGNRDDGLDTRFGIRHIFVWTAIVSVFLAIVRLISQFVLSDPQSPNSLDWTIFGILTLGNSVIILPLIWAAFSLHRLPLRIGGAIVWAVVLSIVQFWFMSLTIPINNEFALFVTLNLIQFLVAFALLISLRAFGLRLLLAS